MLKYFSSKLTVQKSRLGYFFVIGYWSIILLFISACSAIPLGSMMKIANMSDDELLSINPAKLGARITIDAPAKLQIRDVTLALKFEYFDTSEREYRFLLASADSAKTIEEDTWWGGMTTRNQYEFKINQNSVDEFSRYQLEFVKFGRPKRYYWQVYYYLDSKPAKGNPLNLDLELKFSDQEDYFYLLKNAELKVN